MKKPASQPMLSELGEITTSNSTPPLQRSRSCGLLFASLPGSLWEEQLAHQGSTGSMRRVESECDREAQLFLQRIRTSKFVKYIDDNVLNYNTEGIIGIGVFWAATTAASVFRKGGVFRDLMFTWLFGFAAYISIVSSKGLQEITDDAQHLKDVVVDFHSICTFLLGFFISTCISRWWVIRQDGIGGLWGNLDDLCMLVGALFPTNSDADREVRERVLRWGVLSHELMYKQIRDSHYLSDLVDQGLLLESELAILTPLASKPQVVWAWMCSYFAHLAYGDPTHGGSRLPYPVTLLPQLLAFSCKSRDAIGLLFTLTDSQLPFRYVHILSMIVWIHNLLQALASAVIMHKYSLQGDSMGVARELIFVTIYPTLYLGLLHLGAGLLNPMRSESDVDYPRAAFTYYMVAENQSFFSGTAPPKGPPYAPNNPPVWQGQGSLGQIKEEMRSFG